MFGRIRFAKRLFRDLPSHSKLAYCLLRDERVSTVHKAAFGATLAIGLNPFVNLPEFIPVLGELDGLAVTLLALRVFIAITPAHIVDEHRRLILDGRSSWDHDLRAGEGRLAHLTQTVTRRFGSNSDGPSAHESSQLGTPVVIELPRSTSPPNERQISA